LQCSSFTEKETVARYALIAMMERIIEIHKPISQILQAKAKATLLKADQGVVAVGLAAAAHRVVGNCECHIRWTNKQSLNCLIIIKFNVPNRVQTIPYLHLRDILDAASF